MEFNGVFHQAYDNYCYPINEDELIINIKTGYDVKEVNIILGDPFAAGIGMAINSRLFLRKN